MNDPHWERHADDVALARYSVISPLVCRQLSNPEYLETKDQILTAVHLFPDGKTRQLSRRALERWCDWYLHGHTNADGEVVTEPGIEALRPLPRLDKGVPRVLDDALVERAIFLRREDPARTTSTLIDLLKTEAAQGGRPEPDVIEATLAYHLRQRKATKRDLKRESRAFRRYEQPRRNSTWQADWTKGFLIADPSSPKAPRLCHLHAVLDDYSRYIVHAEFYFHQNLPCTEDCFRKAIVHGGIPEKVYWDNGAVYHSRQVRLITARLGTEIIFATPYCPQGKGKIERWFWTVKMGFYPEAQRAGIQSLAELNEFFWGWLERCYQTKVHSESEQTPLARWDAGASGVRYPEPARLVDLFLWEESRRVDKSGCIQLAGNLYPVAEHLVGREVSVRFDPFDMSRVRLYDGEQCSQILEPQTLVSQTFRKATPRPKKSDVERPSSAAYRDHVAQEFRKRARDTVSQARGRGGQPILSQPEFFALLQENFGARQLTAAEAKWVEDFYLRNAPLLEDLVRKALQRAVEAKGASRHIRYYLDCVRAARLDERSA
jgi:putative transposase